MKFRIGFAGIAIAASLLASAQAAADEKTRWSVFKPELDLRTCGNADSNVARSYCYDELQKKLRRGIRWSNLFVMRRLEAKVSLPDDYNKFQGKYAKEAIQKIKAATSAYSLLISNDCSVASWAMRGGSGEGLLAQSCEIDHLIRLFGRYSIFLEDQSF